MKNRLQNPLSNLFKIGLIACPIFIFSSDIPVKSNLMELADSGKIQDGREIYNSFDDDDQKTSILDVANPMELMNRLRRATAMDDATTPVDAVDEALRAFDDLE